MHHDGIRFPAHFRSEFIERALDYFQSPNDILIVSYPKCGVHWLCHILGLVLNDFEPPNPAVYLEAAGDDGNPDPTKERIVFTHLPRKLFLNDTKGLQSNKHKIQRVIYLCRNPADIIVSYFHHCKKLSSLYDDTPGNLEDFAKEFLNGKSCYGSYFEHIKDWLDSPDFEIHLISYEELHDDFANTVEKLLRFLGKQDLIEKDKELKLSHLREITKVQMTRKLVTNQLNETIQRTAEVNHLNFVQCTEIENLQRCQKQAIDNYISAFVRNGTVGEGANTLKPSTLKMILDRCKHDLKNSPLVDAWMPYLYNNTQFDIVDR